MKRAAAVTLSPCQSLLATLLSSAFSAITDNKLQCIKETAESRRHMSRQGGKTFRQTLEETPIHAQHSNREWKTLRQTLEGTQ